MWTCITCGETSEDAADACWNCGTSREGLPDPTFHSADDPPFDQTGRTEPPRPGTCPHCNSENIARDSASPWILVLAVLLFPIGLLLFPLNDNVWCRDCGTRFRRVARPSHGDLPSPVPVYSAANDVEAHWICNLLSDAGVEAFVTEDAQVGQIPRPQVWVDRRFVERAKPILQDYERCVLQRENYSPAK